MSGRPEDRCPACGGAHVWDCACMCQEPECVRQAHADPVHYDRDSNAWMTVEVVVGVQLEIASTESRPRRS